VTTDQNWYSHGGLAVLGVGYALPGAPISNDQLFEWVHPHVPDLKARKLKAAADQLGIKTRHISRAFAARVESPAPGARNPDLAARAVTAALTEAGLAANDLGYLIGHTTTPAQPLPSNIAFVADALGYAGPHLELRQACTGFANALMIAFGLLAPRGARPVAIVGSETGSLFFDPAEAATNRDQLVNLVQMGDGAGAIILGRAGSSSHRVSCAWFGATGLGRAPGLQMRWGGSDHPGTPHEVQTFAQDYGAIASGGPALFAAGVSAAAHQGQTPRRATWIIPHQASGRIGAQVGAGLDVPVESVFVNADRVGNTGSAAIWLALAQLRAQGLEKGQTVLALGAEATKYMHGGFLYEHG
jgi:3-oxoacyl-[acyl-carrier-protein] synthase-3